jgi:hypothetical protein
MLQIPVIIAAAADGIEVTHISISFSQCESGFQVVVRGF